MKTAEKEQESKAAAKGAKNAAWKAFNISMKPDLDAALTIMDKAILQSSHKKVISDLKKELETTLNPLRSD